MTRLASIKAKAHGPDVAWLISELESARESRSWWRTMAIEGWVGAVALVLILWGTR